MLFEILDVFANPLYSKFDLKVAKLAVLCVSALRFFNEYFSLAFFVSMVPVTMVLAALFKDANSKKVKTVNKDMFFKARMITTKVTVYD